MQVQGAAYSRLLCHGEELEPGMGCSVTQTAREGAGACGGSGCIGGGGLMLRVHSTVICRGGDWVSTRCKGLGLCGGV